MLMFNIYAQEKNHAELSWVWKKFKQVSSKPKRLSGGDVSYKESNNLLQKLFPFENMFAIYESIWECKYTSW